MSENLSDSSARGRALVEVLISLSLVSITLPPLYGLLEFRFKKVAQIEDDFARASQTHAFSIVSEQASCTPTTHDTLVVWSCRQRDSSRKLFITYPEHDPI